MQHARLRKRHNNAPTREEFNLPLAHLIGPGGAGKTTIGSILADRLNWRFVDMDQCFLSSLGNIAEFIERNGYVEYARHNVQLYEQLKREVTEPTICAVSSGFMTYPLDITPRYPSIRDYIEADVLTALLLPTFDLESCSNLIVARQLSRPYLKANEADELRKIRDRFPVFMRLNCERFRSDGSPEQIATTVEQFIRKSLASTDSRPI
ncbi:shikimate kinase [Paraburkholderia acidicola]|uniref:shikimate kinase n=1 Tax=Paraburkholderia acidicola TaxID=1912599 RepID=UPI0014750561|nr:shikimate kinase [Paraburkholderia acidicola]